MFRTVVLILAISSSLYSMSLSLVKTAPKEKIGCIKGIGFKRLQSILEYRKEHNLTSLEELLYVKGIGVAILNNINEDKIKKSCKLDRKDDRRNIRKKSISAE